MRYRAGNRVGEIIPPFANPRSIRDLRPCASMIPILLQSLDHRCKCNYVEQRFRIVNRKRPFVTKGFH
jgi:hypothetical protein